MSSSLIEEKTRFVQHIVVSKDGSHEDTITAVAHASVKVYKTYGIIDPIGWNQWMRDHYTKIVRRADASGFKGVLDSPLRKSYVKYNKSEAIALEPTLISPSVVKRLQVSGTNLDRTGRWPVHEPYGNGESLPMIYVALNLSIGMTTGKAAAQAAHGLFSYVQNEDPNAAYLRWSCTDNPDIFAALNETASTKITDAGFTEIPPGTLTVIVGKLS